MSSIIRIFLSLTVLIALFDNILIRSHLSVQYTHAINDCHHLCFGVDSCEEDCEKGFTRSRHSDSDSSATQSRDSDSDSNSDSSPILNFASPVAKEADTPIKNDNSKAKGAKAVKSFHSLRTPSHCGLRFAGKRSGASGMGRIVGGQDAEPNEFPWLVSLQWKTNGNTLKHFCGAAILSEYYILTAAHCMDSFRANVKQVVIKAGINSIKDPGQVILVEKLVFHERWSDEQKLNDLTLIKVTKPIKFTVNNHGQYVVNAICLPPDDNEPPYATLSGWGQLGEEEDNAEWLQKITMPLWNRQKCRTNYREYMVIKSSHICAGGREGNKDSCMGDSGGPLITTRGSRSYIIGVVSFGIPCAEKGYPGVYTFVIRFVDWISKHMT